MQQRPGPLSANNGGMPAAADSATSGDTAPPALTAPAEAVAYLRMLEALTPATLTELERFLAVDAQFHDPFHDVQGRTAVLRVFERMFESLRDVSFVVDAAAGRPGLCLARWQFRARLAGGRRSPLAFTGMSDIRFNPDGLVSRHEDVWDPTAAVFDHVPLLGFVLRRLKRRLAAG